MIVLLICFSTNLYALSNEDKPTVVRIGVYVTSLYNFNYKMGTFSSSFYLWTITKDANYNPFRSLEIVNSTDYKIKNHTKGKNPDGTTFNTFHVYSTNQHYWDIKYFPFDVQKLKIRVEDANDAQDVKFVADGKQSGVFGDIELPGWKITDVDFFVSPYIYDSNFGDYNSSGNIYSRFTAIITIKREGLRIFFNYFAGFIVGLILSATIFFINPDEIGARSSYSIGAIFAIIGNKFIIDGHLPTVNEYTLVDAIQFLSFAQVIAAMFVTLKAYNLVKNRNVKKAKILSKRCGFIIVPIVFISLIFFVLNAFFA
jgi:hypothetical protein